MHSGVMLVTGAGAGIGRELTRLGLAHGAKVLAVSLLDEELANLRAELDPAGTRLTTLAMDLSEPEAAETLFHWCQERALVVEVLMNNAGFACYGDTVDLGGSKLDRMLALNVVTLTQLCRLFGAQMKQRRSGRILNVGSTAGMVPAPRLAAYGASKSYVNTFSYALRVELAPYNVQVTCLTPGTVQTKFAEAGDFLSFKGDSRLKQEYLTRRASPPAAVARAAFAGLMAGKAQVRVGKGSILAAIASRLIAQRTLPTLLKNV